MLSLVALRKADSHLSAKYFWNIRVTAMTDIDAARQVSRPPQIINAMVR